MIVEQGSEQGMRARDGVEVAREVEIDVVHRDDLGISPSGGAALHAEHRPEAWLTDAQRDLLAHAAQRLREANGYGAFSLARRRRVRGRDDDEAAANWTRRDLDRNLRLVLAIQIEIVAPESQFGGDILDGSHLGAL